MSIKTTTFFLTKTKETKGTFLYTTDDDKAPTKSVYIKKAVIDGEAPESLKITVEVGSE